MPTIVIGNNNAILTSKKLRKKQAKRIHISFVHKNVTGIVQSLLLNGRGPGPDPTDERWNRNVFASTHLRVRVQKM